jgi:hypothetical protein
MKSLVTTIALIAFLPLQAAEKKTAIGEVFDLSGKNKQFTYERFEDNKGDSSTIRAVYKDLDGKVLTEEVMSLQKGELVKYEIQQKQTNEKGWIEVAGDKVTFNLKKPKKRNYPQTEDKPKDFIVGLMIVPTIKKSWDTIIKGKNKEIRLGVWHRQESVGFKLSKEKVDDKQMVVKMAATSFLIRAIVKPLYFTFDVKTKNLVSYKGRVTPKEKRGRRYRDFDGLTTYKILN